MEKQQNIHFILAEMERFRQLFIPKNEELERQRIQLLNSTRFKLGRRGEKYLPEQLVNGQLPLFGDDGTDYVIEEEKQAAKIAEDIKVQTKQQRVLSIQKQIEQFDDDFKRISKNLSTEIRYAYPKEFNRELYDVVDHEEIERLDVYPVKFYRKITRYAIIQLKSENNHPNPTRIKVDLPQLVLSGCYASRELMAQIVADKILSHTSEYHQNQKFKSKGANIPLSTIKRWVHCVADELYNLYIVHCNNVLKSNYIQIDETESRIKDAPDHVRNGYIWAVRDASSSNRGIFFHYDESPQSRHVIVDLLKNFKGTIQTDGYETYSIYETKLGVIPLGCMARIRKEFEKLEAFDPRAIYALEKISRLYALEKELKDSGATPAQIACERQEKAYPILCQLEGWMRSEFSRSREQSGLSNVISYAYGMWIRMSRYVSDGRYQIDNEAIEHCIGQLSTTRKNYLFFGKEKHIEDNAIFYSLIGSCFETGVDPRKWLSDTLVKIRRNMNETELLELLPRRK